MKLSYSLHTLTHTDLSLENSVMTLLRFYHRAKKTPNVAKSMSLSSTHSLQTVMNRSTNNHLVCLSLLWKFWYHYSCVCLQAWEAPDLTSVFWYRAAETNIIRQNWDERKELTKPSPKKFCHYVLPVTDAPSRDESRHTFPQASSCNYTIRVMEFAFIKLQLLCDSCFTLMMNGIEGLQNFTLIAVI